MLIMNFKNFGKFLLLPTMVLVLSSCNTLDRLSRLGQSPELTNITNPHKAAGYKPISMPMPTLPEQPGNTTHYGRKVHGHFSKIRGQVR